jgi:hypothetical protein
MKPLSPEVKQERRSVERVWFRGPACEMEDTLAWLRANGFRTTHEGSDENGFVIVGEKETIIEPFPPLIPLP